MTSFRVNANAMETVASKLDELGLRRAKDELVVIGGAAMAIYDIKVLADTDLDVAVTDELFAHLTHDDRWATMASDGAVAKGVGIEHVVSRDYDGIKTRKGDVTAIPVPLSDSIYDHITIDDLLGESADIPFMDYHVLGIPRILDWKLALGMAEHPKKDKHMADALKISEYLLGFQ